MLYEVITDGDLDCCINFRLSTVATGSTHPAGEGPLSGQSYPATRALKGLKIMHQILKIFGYRAERTVK